MKSITMMEAVKQQVRNNFLAEKATRIYSITPVGERFYKGMDEMQLANVKISVTTWNGKTATSTILVEYCVFKYDLNLNAKIVDATELYDKILSNYGMN